MRYKTMSPKQRKAMLWWADPHTDHYDAIICDGSVRSGKTMSMSVGFLIWSLSRFDHQTFALCGKTIDSLRRNVITPLQTWVEHLHTGLQGRTFHNHHEFISTGRITFHL